MAVEASRVARFSGMSELTILGWNMPLGPYFSVSGSALGSSFSEIVERYLFLLDFLYVYTQQTYVCENVCDVLLFLFVLVQAHICVFCLCLCNYVFFLLMLALV